MEEFGEWALEMVCLDGRNFFGIYSFSTIASSVIAEIAMYTVEQSRIRRCYETEEEKTPNPEKNHLTKKRKTSNFSAVHVSTAIKSQPLHKSAFNRRPLI
jgi:hypothetical protein